MIACAIIENDPLAKDSLSNLINTNFCEELMVIGSASSATKGLELIRQKSPELIFLDIELPQQAGFYLFTYLFTQNIDVILISSNREFVISAFKSTSTDYLTKPFNLPDLRACIDRLKKKKSAQGSTNETVKQLISNLKMGASYQEKIALPTTDGFQVIHFNEILYCQASENYSYVNMVTGDSFLITKTLKSIEELLPSSSFFRIHKSILLNINYVKSFSRKDGFTVTLENKQQFEIATRRHEEFINLFLRKGIDTHVPNEKVRFPDETLN
jgi:two-component system LytT family response regulator